MPFEERLVRDRLGADVVWELNIVMNLDAKSNHQAMAMIH